MVSANFTYLRPIALRASRPRTEISDFLDSRSHVLTFSRSHVLTLSRSPAPLRPRHLQLVAPNRVKLHFCFVALPTLDCGLWTADGGPWTGSSPVRRFLCRLPARHLGNRLLPPSRPGRPSRAPLSPPNRKSSRPEPDKNQKSLISTRVCEPKPRSCPISIGG